MLWSKLNIVKTVGKFLHLRITGSVGVVVLACVATTIFVADIPNLIRAVIQISKHSQSKKAEQKGPNSCVNNADKNSTESTNTEGIKNGAETDTQDEIITEIIE